MVLFLISAKHSECGTLKEDIIDSPTREEENGKIGMLNKPQLPHSLSTDMLHSITVTKGEPQRLS
jgi:hypothetical protein